MTTVVDVAPWAATKWQAIMAHHSEVSRERSLPALLARAPEETRNKIIQTEYFARLTPAAIPDDPHRLTA